jgi:hypothetical protein
MNQDTLLMQSALLADIKAMTDFSTVKTFALYTGQLRDDEEVFDKALSTPAILSLWQSSDYSSMVENNAKYYVATAINLLLCTHNPADRDRSATDAENILDLLVKNLSGTNLQYTDADGADKSLKIRIAKSALVIKTESKAVVNLQINLEGMR